MCGIAGALDLEGRRTFPLARVLAMTGALTHRGPDDEGVHREPGVCLGARRLSIIDLAGGHQPIGNEDGSIRVAFNGELFEYRELRPELLARGHRLATHCDTEAWVHLYEDHGAAMFDHARGQFAVSLWDRDERTLILGRDRVGICPLYYARSDGWLLWASEIKALFASGLVEPRPDVKGLDYFFHTFASAPQRTMFEGVSALPPGTFLKVVDGEPTWHRYWDLDYPDDGDEVRLKDPTPLVEELEARLERAVERRLRSDVPVVSYLSGGLDSTVVLGLVTRRRGRGMPSFSIALEQAGPDERTKAAESAEVLGSPLTSVVMDRAAISGTYPELIRAAEMPVLDTACACLVRLAATVHGQGYKVALTGEGADEALAGYFWFKGQMIRNRIRRTGAGRWATSKVRDLVLAMVGGGDAHRPPRAPIGDGLRTAQADVYDMLAQSRERLFSDAMWDRLDGHNAYDDLNAVVHPDIGRWHPLNQSLYVGYKVHLTGLLLHAKGDRIAMNSSVETRYPFLDDEVIEHCAAVAPEYKLRGMTDKWILRQVAARTLPAQIANRRKTMFEASRGAVFLGPDRPAWVDQLLAPESLAATGYFDAEGVARARRLWERLPKFTARHIALDLGLTCLVSTQLWHHTFLGGGLCELPTWTATGATEATSIPDTMEEPATYSDAATR